MYKVYCDGFLIYHSKLESLQIFNPSIELELNKTGSFDFTIYSDHPYYNLVQKLKSTVTVYQDDYPIFSGRVLDDEVGWHNEKHVVCEGDFAAKIKDRSKCHGFKATAHTGANSETVFVHPFDARAKRIMVKGIHTLFNSIFFRIAIPMLPDGCCALAYAVQP